MAEELDRAARKRLDAARARRLASGLSNNDSVAALLKYAEECEKDARRQLEELRTGLNDAVPAAANASMPKPGALVCLDCGRVLIGSSDDDYVCLTCGSRESIFIDEAGRES